MKLSNTQAILIVGAGLGGTALLDIFSLEENVRIVGIVDTNPEAMGIEVARERKIPAYTNLEQALEISGPCMVFNTTNDSGFDELLARHVGVGGVIGGKEAKFFWSLISQLQSVKCELLENQIRMQAVIHNVQDGIISITSDGIIEAVNPAIEAIFGYQANELVGQIITLLIPGICANQQGASLDNYRINEECLGTRTEIAAIHKGGKNFPLEISMTRMVLNGNRHFVVMARDITERKIAEEKLTQLALYDSLTGLPNRTNFFERLEFSLAHARRSNTLVALLFIDLDGFKTINDHMGHAGGDCLLREVGLRLQDCVRESDTVARIGGDEFTVILNNLQNIDEAALVAQKLISVLSQPVRYEENKCCQVGASIGIGIFPDHGQAADELIKVADGAMYRAKASGKNCYVVCY